MKIDVLPYTIINDDYGNHFITEKQTNEKGKQIEKRVTGYCINNKQMFQSLIENKLYKSDISNVKQVVEKLEEIEIEVMNIAERAVALIS